MTTDNSGALIGLDWGTTSLRAHLLDSEGRVLDRGSSAEGILADHVGGFADTFQRVVGNWLDASPGVPVMASGMITSRNGWVETSYVPVPAGIDELASSLVCFDLSSSRQIHFVCGMEQDPPGGTPDIMRGEETQIVGCLSQAGDEELFVMPGTHSKWVNVRDGRVVRFDTYMTGEVFAVLKEYSILGRLMDAVEGPITAGFARGVSSRLESDASLLRHIFSGRTLALFDRLDSADIADYLSGLLIGEEVRSALRDYRTDGGGVPRVTIVGSGALTDRYLAALAHAGIDAAPAPEDAAARGHFAIARRAGLIGG